MKNRMCIALLVSCGLMMAACGSSTEGSSGNCTIQTKANGTATLVCPDGTSFDLSKGAEGSSCTVEENEDGTRTISCDDGTSVTLSDGSPGQAGPTGEQGSDGSSCSVADNGDGSKTLNCEDGTSAIIYDGALGARGQDGRDGQDAGPCTVTSEWDGSATINCPDGSETRVPVTCGPGTAIVGEFSFFDGRAEIVGNDAVDLGSAVNLSFQYRANGETRCQDCNLHITFAYYSPETHFSAASRCVTVETNSCTVDGLPEVVDGFALPTPATPGEFELRAFVFYGTQTCAQASQALARLTDPNAGIPVGRVETKIPNECSNSLRYTHDVQINGQPGSRITAAPGEVFTLTYPYVHVRNEGCPGCVDPFIVGIEGQQLDCAHESSGFTCPGRTDTRTVSVTAPSQPGIYPVYWNTSWVFNCSDVPRTVGDGRRNFAVIEVVAP
jgi:hypothetical protein